MSTMRERLRELMEANPRLTSREYAELAIRRKLASDIDADELLLRELQREVRGVVRESKSDPQLAFVSITEACQDGSKKDVYVPAQACTQPEAQLMLDREASKIEGEIKNLRAFFELWTGPGYGYQLRFNWG